MGITHVTSSPLHRQANVKVELEKCEVERTGLYEAILEQRNTQRQEICVSPAKVMFNRTLRGMIPQLQQKLEKPETLEIARREITADRQ